MGFDKAYPNRKDWRAPYRRAAAFDSSCRPHGSCSWCRENRTVALRRARLRAEELLTDFWQEDENVDAYNDGGNAAEGGA